jgi:hypothetical protein
MRVSLALLIVGFALLGGGLVVTTASSSPGGVGAVHSPGGLDYRGGHHCWTRCYRYGLYTGQYHCHRYPCNRSDIRRHRAHGH